MAARQARGRNDRDARLHAVEARGSFERSSMLWRMHAMTEIWLINVQRSALALAELEREAPRLTPQERRRASAIQDPHKRHERIAIATALRILLERIAGPQAAKAPFVTGAAGKPRLADGSVQFSLSHIEGYALIGLSRAGEIGVDLERDRPLRMSERRRAELMAAAVGLAGRLAGTSPDARFLLAWCRLEAFAKARGHGLGRTLADLGLRSGRQRTSADIEAAAREAVRAAGLTVRDVRLEPGLYAAVALGDVARVPPKRFPADRAGIERLLTLSRPARRRAG
jgi:4'-phosphopantetheinyl transferase